MVLSTVHTNSVMGAVDRLLDLGVPGFLLAATLRGVVSQRLVGRLCPECAQPDLGAALGLSAELRGERLGEPSTFMTADGCGHTGRQGQQILVEFLEIDEAMSSVLVKGESGDDLAGLARARGVPKLADHALRLAAGGAILTTDLFAV